MYYKKDHESHRFVPLCANLTEFDPNIMIFLTHNLHVGLFYSKGHAVIYFRTKPRLPTDRCNCPRLVIE